MSGENSNAPAPPSKDRNVGHGHVFKRPDGIKARCGGPGLCSECSRDLARAEQEQLDRPRKPYSNPSGRHDAP
jgi:hypothetical protein